MPESDFDARWERQPERDGSDLARAARLEAERQLLGETGRPLYTPARGPLTSGDALRVAEPCGPVPPASGCPRGAWRCDSSTCGVREVTVRGAWGWRAPPGMRCPGCGRNMRFLHYLRQILLQPLSGDGPADGT